MERLTESRSALHHSVMNEGHTRRATRTLELLRTAVYRFATMRMTTTDLERIAARAGVLPSVALEALLGNPNQLRKSHAERIRELVDHP